MKHFYILLAVATCVFSSQDRHRLNLLPKAIIVSPENMESLGKLDDSDELSASCKLARKASQWPLYRFYPHLKKTLPRIILCDLPTPAEHLDNLSKVLGVDCYIKRDDLVSVLVHGKPRAFAGNKRRKAELIFADMLQGSPVGKQDTVITFGCVGSNHAVAIASCAQELGIKCILLLKPEPNSLLVRRNLLLMQHYGAQIYFYPNEEHRTKGALEIFKQHKIDHGFFPYIIPTGGALPLGAVGYVNAAFELKEQVMQGIIKQPDVIYLSGGGTFQVGVSCGTTAGIVLGLKAAGLSIKVMVVCSQPENIISYRKALMSFIQQTNVLLHKADSSFPLVTINDNDVEVIGDCAGTKYGLFTKEGVEALRLLRTTENIELDGTYTGKAFSALVRDARLGKLKGKRVLFWNTFCGGDFSAIITMQDYKKLPQGLHKYFTEELQPLER